MLQHAHFSSNVRLTRFLASQQYYLSLRIPCKGIGSTLDASPFVPVVLSAQELGTPADQSDVPPEFFLGEGSGFDNDKLSVL